MKFLAISTTTAPDPRVAPPTWERTAVLRTAITYDGRIVERWSFEDDWIDIGPVSKPPAPLPRDSKPKRRARR